MFGYLESPYTVIRQADVTTKDGSVQHFELRQPSRGPRGQYIALESAARNGRPALDLLYLYDDPSKLEMDWARLISDEVVHRDDMGWSELIEGHHLGLFKNGGVAMY